MNHLNSDIGTGEGAGWLLSLENGELDGAAEARGLAATGLGADGSAHLVVADMQPYGTGHQDVVVFSGHGTVTAVFTAAVGEVFVDACLFPLHIQTLTHYAHQIGYYHGFGADIGMEAELTRLALYDVFRRLATRIQVAVSHPQLV